MRLLIQLILVLISFLQVQTTVLGANFCQDVFLKNNMNIELNRILESYSSSSFNKIPMAEKLILIDSLVVILSKNSIMENTIILKIIFSDNQPLVDRINFQMDTRTTVVNLLLEMNTHYGNISSRASDGPYHLSKLLDVKVSKDLAVGNIKTLSPQVIDKVVEILDQMSQQGQNNYSQLSANDKKIIMDAVIETLPFAAKERLDHFTSIYEAYTGFTYLVGSIAFSNSALTTTMHIVEQLSVHGLWTLKDSKGEYQFIKLISN